MVKFDGVKENDLMAVVMYAKVIGKQLFAGKHLFGDVQFNNVDTNEDFSVQGVELVEKMFSADWFGEVKKVTKTEIAEILSNSFNVPFTVVFEKLSGETRILRGRLVKPEHLMG